MTPTRAGSLRLCRFAGIDVFVHWSWFVIAVFAVQARAGIYSGFIWNVYEYLALFAIVLMHEFGHALACKQVGGTAKEIILWPLGGVAYVSPPPRAGAHLWSIAAGPLVNAALVPVFYFLEQWARTSGVLVQMPDLFRLIYWAGQINLLLLIFNMLPVYPLDGGQILRSLLWFFIGPWKSIMVASIIGFVGVAGLAFLAILQESIWGGILAFFVYLNCKRGWLHARAMMKVSELPRNKAFACPACKNSPPNGEIWVCQRCETQFDMFAANATCPNCAMEFPPPRCLHCGQAHPIEEWKKAEIRMNG